MGFPDLTAKQRKVIAVLDRAPEPLTVAGVNNQVGGNWNRMAKALDDLWQMGLVGHDVNQFDRRVFFLTERGKQWHECMRLAEGEWEQCLAERPRRAA